MSSFLTGIPALILYLIATALIARRLKYARQTESRRPILITTTIAIALHAVQLYNTIVTTQGFNLSLFNSLSLSAAVISLLIMIAFAFRSLDLLIMLILPVTASTLLLAMLFPAQYVLPTTSPSGLEVHIIISIIAYSLMAIATLHAIFLSIQNKHLHNHQALGIVRLLPPLQEMEKLLFEIIFGGFIFLSIALATGFLFLENMFQQHLVHKTILSILAWVLYAILLLGHWILGWRGRTAVRWTVGGFICLMLAYIGSKFVLEYILG